jgi:hypothetical protein
MARQTQRGRGLGKALTFTASCGSPCGDLGDSLAPVSPYKPWTGGPPLGLTLNLEFTTEPRMGTPHLAAGLHLRFSLLYTLTQYSISTLLPKPERHGFTPTGSWEVIRLPFCLLRHGWIWTPVLTSMKSGVPKLVPAPQWVPLCIRGPRPNLLGGWIPPSGSSCPLAPGRISSQQSGGCTLVTREVITHHLQ